MGVLFYLPIVSKGTYRAEFSPFSPAFNPYAALFTTSSKTFFSWAKSSEMNHVKVLAGSRTGMGRGRGDG